MSSFIHHFSSVFCIGEGGEKRIDSKNLITSGSEPRRMWMGHEEKKTPRQTSQSISIDENDWLDLLSHDSEIKFKFQF